MIEILLEHAWYLVINKPSGLLTQAVPGVDSVQTMLVEQLQARDGLTPKPFIGMPHRLDRVTSGAMVVARNQRALRRLSDQFASRKVRKIYHAIVPRVALDRKNDEMVYEWHDWMRKVENEPRAEIVHDSEDKDAKKAILRFQVLQELVIELSPAKTSQSDQNNTSVDVDLVEIELETGRMHQIRLQFGSRGCPILGDVLYGSPWRWLNEVPGERESPIALHASKIEFHDPQNAEKVSVVAPYPDGWDCGGIRKNSQ